jgi:GNAT superfamily N-acetyltransferase
MSHVVTEINQILSHSLLRGRLFRRKYVLRDDLASIVPGGRSRHDGSDMASVIQRKRLLAVRPMAEQVVGLRLRCYQSERDIPGWLSLRERAFAREKVGVRRWDLADFHREFLDRPWWRPDWMWFAETTCERPIEPVGSVTLALRLSAEGTVPVIHWLCVLPAWRRRGLGRLLMTTLEQAAWDEGYRQIALETHESWRAAAACYDALGYEIVLPRPAT